MKLNIKSIFMMIIVLIAGLSIKIDAKENVYDLNKLSEIVLENNFTIKKARADLKKADAVMMQAKSAFIPDITVSKTFTRFNNNNTGEDDGDMWKLEAIQPLYTGGALSAGISIAKKNLQIAGFNYKKVKEDVLFNLVNLYYSILKLEDTVNTLKESMTALNEHQKVTKQHMEAGVLTKSDMLRVDAEKSKVSLMLLNTKGNLEKTRSNLHFLCGGKIAEDFKVSRKNLEFSKVSLLDNMFEIAKENRLDLKMVKNALYISRDNVKISKSERIPHIALVGSKTEGSKIVTFPESWQASANISMNLFDGGYINGVIREKKLDSQNAQISYEELLQAIKMECNNSRIDVDTSWKNIQVSKKIVDSANETLRLVENQYKNGIVSSVILLDDEVKLIEANNNYLGAIYDYKISIVKYFKSAGKLEEKIFSE